MEIVTGKRGFPHVSSYEMQTFQRGLVSDGDVLLDVGDKLNYTIVDNNTIRILSGAILMQGIYCIIPYGTYDEMYIDSIAPGKVRKDVIYAQYNRDLETGMEEVIMDVKKGTEVNTGETPVQPSFPSPVTPLWEGGSFAYVKLYEVTVTYNAISVAEILDRSRVLLTPLQSVGQSVGDPVNLTTTDKSNIVSAVNEVNGKANANANNIVTMIEDISGLQGRMTTAEGDIDTLEGDIDTLEGGIDTLESAVFSERKVYTERFATNMTGNGRLMLMVSAWKKDTACVNVRFSNRVTGGFTDVVLMIKQNSYYTKCKQMYNDGIGISKIYRGSNNTTFDFEIPTSTNNAYDVYVTAPVWVSGTYGAQSTLDGTEMTIDRFNYNEMELTVGNLSNLSTTTHSNIVAAINEVNGRIVESDYVITEYSVPYVSGSNAIFMIRSNDVSVVGDEEYLLNVEIIKSNGNAVEMLFLTTDDSVLNSKVVINQRSQTSNFEAIPISKVEDATSFVSGNNAVLWITLGGTPDVTVRLTHHKSKTYTVVASPAMPSGTGREINFVNGNTELYSTKDGSIVNYVSTKNGAVTIASTSDATFDIAIINEGGRNPNIRMFTLQGDVNINGNYVGKTDVSGIGDGTITGAIAFSNEDGEEVSGEVVTVTDAVDANTVGLSVDIEPVQDLHGYSKPWVGGAGKNKLPMTVDGIRSANTSGTWSGNAYTYNGVTFTIQTDNDSNVTGINADGTASSIAFFNVGVYTASAGDILNGCPAGGGNNGPYKIMGIDATTSDTGDGKVIVNGVGQEATYRIVIWSNATVTNLKFYPMIRKSTELDASFEPYSNICNIGAVTETDGEPQIEIQRVGKNLFDTQNTINGFWGGDSTIGYANSTRIAFAKCHPNTTYTVSKTVGKRFSVAYITEDTVRTGINVYGKIVDDESTSITITTGDNATYVVAYVYHSSYDSITAEQMIASVQIELGNQATDFEPYQGETYIIKTDDNVYGAHHDATTGKMVVTHGFAEYDGSSDEAWTKYTVTQGSLYRTVNTNRVYGDLSTDAKAVCNECPVVVNSQRNLYTLSGENNNIDIILSQSDITTSFTDWLASHPLQVCYKLATPQTINLTPQQIKLLKGTDTVSSNAQTLNLTYLKDNAVGRSVSIVEKEIEPQIEEIHNEINTKMNADSIAPVENEATASTSYAVGSYIVRNNNLYKVISAISQGATFTNNNIQQTTVMAEILARL